MLLKISIAIHCYLSVTDWHTIINFSFTIKIDFIKENILQNELISNYDLLSLANKSNYLSSVRKGNDPKATNTFPTTYIW